MPPPVFPPADRAVAARVGAAGVAVATPSAPNTATEMAVAFPGGTFAAAPIVVVSPSISAPAGAWVGISNRSAANFILIFSNSTGASMEVNWIAVPV